MRFIIKYPFLFVKINTIRKHGENIKKPSQTSINIIQLDRMGVSTVNRNIFYILTLN